MTASMHKTRVALKLPTRNPALIRVAQSILAAMTDNPSLPAPTPSLATVAAVLADLMAAEAASLTRTRGTADARNEKRTVLVGLLARLKAYVQGVADDNPEHAEALIESAGMHRAKSVAPGKPPFAVKQGRVSGSVRMTVRSAGDRARYFWEWSADGGQTWRSAPSTIQASTALEGLPAGMTCSFRTRVVTLTGEADWSEPLSLLIP